MSELDEIIEESQGRRAQRAADRAAAREEAQQDADTVTARPDLPDENFWRKAEREQAINRAISRADR